MADHSGPAGGRAAESRQVELLGRRLRLRHPRRGFGITSDAVLLASAVPVAAGMRVLDAGCGSGAVGLCLARRAPGLALHGIEIDPVLAGHARDNGARNGIGNWQVVAGDLFAPPPALRRQRFQRVVTNPPWQRAGAGTPSPDPGRRRALREAGGGRGLAGWMAAAAALLAADGLLVAIVAWPRLEDALALPGSWAVEVQPLAVRAAGPPARALLRLRRDRPAGRRVHPPLALHAGAGYTAEVEAILRSGAAFPWPYLRTGGGLVHNPV